MIYYESTYAKGLNAILPEFIVSHIIYKFDPTFHYKIHKKIMSEIPDKVILWKIKYIYNIDYLSEDEMILLYWWKKYNTK